MREAEYFFCLRPPVEWEGVAATHFVHNCIRLVVPGTLEALIGTRKWPLKENMRLFLV